MAKSYIKLWDSYRSYFEPLGAAEVGRLVLAMMDYKSSGVVPEFTGSEKFIWPAIKRDLDEDAAYTEKKSISGRAGGKSKSKQIEANESTFNQSEAGHRTKDIGLKNKSSSSVDETMTNPIVEEYYKSIGKLTDSQREELIENTEKMGEELVKTIIAKCSDLGAHSWAYIRKALAEAEAQGCTSAEEYLKTNPIGGGRNTRVDRSSPSGNDFLKDAGRRRSLRKKRGE